MPDFLKRSNSEGGDNKPAGRERGRMRRRLRRQQRVREALILDMGALVYELHRQGRREPELLQAKAAELSAVDDEVRALAAALEERQPFAQLVAAGIAGSCETCGALLTSDARFCSSCGAPTGPELEPERGRPGMATAGNGTGLEEDQPAALEAAEELEPEPEPAAPEPPAPSGDWTDDVGVQGPGAPPPPPSPPPYYEPLVNRAGKAARESLRRGLDWLERRRRP